MNALAYFRRQRHAVETTQSTANETSLAPLGIRSRLLFLAQHTAHGRAQLERTVRTCRYQLQLPPRGAEPAGSAAGVARMESAAAERALLGSHLFLLSWLEDAEQHLAAAVEALSAPRVPIGAAAAAPGTFHDESAASSRAPAASATDDAEADQRERSGGAPDTRALRHELVRVRRQRLAQDIRTRIHKVGTSVHEGFWRDVPRARLARDDGRSTAPTPTASSVSHGDRNAVTADAIADAVTNVSPSVFANEYARGGVPLVLVARAAPDDGALTEHMLGRCSGGAEDSTAWWRGIDELRASPLAAARAPRRRFCDFSREYAQLEAVVPPIGASDAPREPLPLFPLSDIIGLNF
jgi:hypothetical protein